MAGVRRNATSSPTSRRDLSSTGSAGPLPCSHESARRSTSRWRRCVCAIDVDYELSQLVQLVNEVRSTGFTCPYFGYQPPVAALTVNDKLMRAAQAHSDDMLAKRTFGMPKEIKCPRIPRLFRLLRKQI